MPEMLILTEAQAADLRGPTTPGRALMPRGPLLDGSYVLPPAVLDDDHGAAVMPKLRSLPQAAVTIPPPPEEQA